ncbi:zinc finger B-box domain-containing protein 1 [Dryobates pubescens]|nr:zinc finger B-box domain-containing protein 1 [Dryobates pubescens]
MNINDFVVLPGSKTGTSVRLKAKTARELQLEKVQLQTENEEMEKRLQQLKSNMSREKEERKASSAYHWKSGQMRPMTTQAQVLSQRRENNTKVSSGKVKLQILKEQLQEPVKERCKHEVANAVAHEKSQGKRIAPGLREIKSALLQTEANRHVGNLEVIDHFSQEGNLKGPKVNREQKNVKVTPDKISSLLVSVGSAEEPPSESTCPSPENQEKGLLLDGTFDEEESARSFQEALLQWRKGNRDHREHPHTSEVLAESVGICEVQTNPTVTKEPIQIEFKKDGLSYMEKLLLKKYRRTPVDQISGSCIKDLRPVQTASVPQAVTGGGEGGDDDDGGDVNDLTVEEVKRYWASLFRQGVANPVSERAESSLQIELLDDSYGNDLEESSDILHEVDAVNSSPGPALALLLSAPGTAAAFPGPEAVTSEATPLRRHRDTASPLPANCRAAQSCSTTFRPPGGSSELSPARHQASRSPRSRSGARRAPRMTNSVPYQARSRSGVPPAPGSYKHTLRLPVHAAVRQRAEALGLLLYTTTEQFRDCLPVFGTGGNTKKPGQMLRSSRTGGTRCCQRLAGRGGYRMRQHWGATSRGQRRAGCSAGDGQPGAAVSARSAPHGHSAAVTCGRRVTARPLRSRRKQPGPSGEGSAE